MSTHSTRRMTTTLAIMILAPAVGCGADDGISSEAAQPAALSTSEPAGPATTAPPGSESADRLPIGGSADGMERWQQSVDERRLAVLDGSDLPASADGTQGWFDSTRP